jgi:DNA-binding NarL/FixJ family response regulator
MEAEAAMARRPHGVLLLDLALLDGAAGVSPGLQSIRRRFPAWHVVALSDEETREGVLLCLAAGAHGAIAKTASAAELLLAVDVVGRGGVHVPAVLAEPPPPSPMPPSPPSARPEPVSQLTERQRDVLRLMAEGRSTKDIARTLDLAVSTIKVHLAAVYRTVGARNRVEALCRAGLLPREPLLS